MEFKKPDLNAPRYRSKKHNLLNRSFYEKFVKKHPKYKDYSLEQIKAIVTTFNSKIWQTAIENRDGIEFPEQLGNTFIGSCPRKKGYNLNYKQSQEYGQKVQYMNWESDQYVAKIFYTNFDKKYRFRFHELWAFQPIREFKRTVGKTYPQEWKKYIVVDNLVKVNVLLRKARYKDILQTQTTQDLESYDEFDLD